MTLGHIGTADGSSFIRLGGTGILCGIKLEFLPALEASQTEGQLGASSGSKVTCRYKCPHHPSLQSHHPSGKTDQRVLLLCADPHEPL